MKTKWPTSLQLRVEEGQRVLFKLWLPFFLLWPVLIFILLLLAPLFLFASVFLIWTSWGRAILCLFLALPELVLCTAGLEVNVESPSEFFKVWVAVK